MRINTRHLLLTATALHAVAFENRPGWKMDGDKLATDANGNPIYIDDAGREIVTESGTIGRLNGEAKQHRERAEKAEAAAKKYEGIDPEAARKALDTVGKLDQKQLIDAGKVDEVKQQITAQYETQLNEVKQVNTTLQAERDGLIKSNAFTKSKFISERVAVPPEMFEKTFGDQFKVEDGKVVPYGRDGNPVYSKKRMGEIADVDEAFEIILETYPHKDTVLKAVQNGGSGNNGGGGQRGQGRFLPRATFDAMEPGAKAAAGEQIRKGELTLQE
jgi:hypothetical protein